jgi:hypothetical protein
MNLANALLDQSVSEQNLMHAKDRYHDTVKRALIKDGWHVLRENATFIIESRHIQIDLKVSKTINDQPMTLFVEIKSFLRQSVMEDLEHAVGQYVLYRLVINDAGIESSRLFLAVPRTAHDSILSEPIGQLTTKELSMRIVVIDIEKEEIVQWNA